MKRHRPLLRPLAPVLAVLASAGLLAACGNDPAPAATVNGIEISQQELIDELEAVRGNEAYLTQVEQQQQVQVEQAVGAGAEYTGPRSVLGTEDGTFDTAYAAQTLNTRILYAIIEAEVARLEVTIDDDCREAARTLVEGDVGAEVLAEFPEDYQQYLIDREADVIALSGELAGFPCQVDDDAVIEGYLDADPGRFARNCLSVIQVNDQATADELAGLLAGGADFATLARERSLDTTTGPSGGVIADCFSAADLGAISAAIALAIGELSVGEISAPIDLGNAFLLLRLDSIEDVDPVADRDQVVAAISEEVNTAFGTWVSTELAAATVEVDPRFGTWNPETRSIDRPAAGGATTTTSTTAVPLVLPTE